MTLDELDMSKCTKQEVDLVELIKNTLEKNSDDMPGLDAMVLSLALAKITKDDKVKNHIHGMLDDWVDDAIKNGGVYLATLNHKTH